MSNTEIEKVIYSGQKEVLVSLNLLGRLSLELESGENLFDPASAEGIFMAIGNLESKLKECLLKKQSG